jgi:V-type H+-transporting ATPase subunit A
MLKCIVTFYEHAQKAIADSSSEKKMTWATIKTTLQPTLQKVIDTKFVEPKQSREAHKAHYDAIVKEIEDAFQGLLDA